LSHSGGRQPETTRRLKRWSTSISFRDRRVVGLLTESYVLRQYYYRADHPKLDDQDWHCFTLSHYDRHSGKWAMEKAPVYHIID
jgi:hypothetical protein